MNPAYYYVPLFRIDDFGHPMQNRPMPHHSRTSANANEPSETVLDKFTNYCAVSCLLVTDKTNRGSSIREGCSPFGIEDPWRVLISNYVETKALISGVIQLQQPYQEVTKNRKCHID
ncbi:MAG: hypothetical protein GY847_11470 [Proteobacteria bacterium]|nr:hypothetical protein [Pseudomonadota bacterium]